jgi:suppressor of G2 allele of SKP1
VSSGVSAISAESKDDVVKRAVLADVGPVYPTSSRTGPKNWDKVANDLVKQGRDPTAKVLDDDEVEGDEVGAFFKNLYKGADDETRRAMMKSYQESNGTVLSTNWSEIGKKKVEISPPDGMVAKKWGE